MEVRRALGRAEDQVRSDRRAEGVAKGKRNHLGNILKHVTEDRIRVQSEVDQLKNKVAALEKDATLSSRALMQKKEQHRETVRSSREAIKKRDDVVLQTRDKIAKRQCLKIEMDNQATSCETFMLSSAQSKTHDDSRKAEILLARVRYVSDVLQSGSDWDTKLRVITDTMRLSKTLQDLVGRTVSRFPPPAQMSVGSQADPPL